MPEVATALCDVCKGEFRVVELRVIEARSTEQEPRNTVFTVCNPCGVKVARTLKHLRMKLVR